MRSPRELDPLERLIPEIHAVNHAWKLARSWYGDDASITSNLRQAKNALQRRLLTLYPEAVRVEATPEEGPDIVGLVLTRPVGGHTDAAHMLLKHVPSPVHVEELA